MIEMLGCGLSNPLLYYHWDRLLTEFLRWVASCTFLVKRSCTENPRFFVVVAKALRRSPQFNGVALLIIRVNNTSRLYYVIWVEWYGDDILALSLFAQKGVHGTILAVDCFAHWRISRDKLHETATHFFLYYILRKKFSQNYFWKTHLTTFKLFKIS